MLQTWKVLSFPRDEILYYANSRFKALSFLFAMLALHYVAPDEVRFWNPVES